jgi:hypothetical protein
MTDIGRDDPAAPAHPVESWMDRHVLVGRVRPIEDLATDGQELTAPDDWQTSAEVAFHFLSAYVEATRRTYGETILELARWCRNIGVAPLRLSPYELRIYLADSDVGNASTGTDSRAAIRGYFEQAVQEQVIVESPMPTV